MHNRQDADSIGRSDLINNPIRVERNFPESFLLKLRHLTINGGIYTLSFLTDKGKTIEQLIDDLLFFWIEAIEIIVLTLIWSKQYEPVKLDIV